MADKALRAFIRLQLRHKWHGRTPVARKPPKWLFPDSAKRDYMRSLQAMVAHIRQAYLDVVAPQIPTIIEMAKRGRGDSWSDELERILENFKIRANGGRLNAKTIPGPIGIQVADFNKKQRDQLIKKSLGVDVVAVEPWLRDDLKSWAAQNADLITTLEEKGIKDVSSWVQNGVRNGWRAEQIADKIESRFSVTANQAKFIARDQVGKLNGQLTEARQTALGIEAYIWRTSMDERVRGNPAGIYPDAIPSHWDKEGKRYTWANPPADTGNPGEDYQCRCTAEADMKNFLKKLGLGEDDDGE